MNDRRLEIRRRFAKMPLIFKIILRKKMISAVSLLCILFMHMKIDFFSPGRRNRFLLSIIMTWLSTTDIVLKLLSTTVKYFRCEHVAFSFRDKLARQLYTSMQRGDLGDKESGGRVLLTRVCHPDRQLYIGPDPQDKAAYPPTSVSFCGCAWLLMYHVGAAAALMERVDWRTLKVCGTSSGSLIAASVSMGVDMSLVRKLVLDMAEDSRKNLLGPIGAMTDYVRTAILSLMPHEGPMLATDRLYISVTRVDVYAVAGVARSSDTAEEDGTEMSAVKPAAVSPRRPAWNWKWGKAKKRGAEGGAGGGVRLWSGNKHGGFVEREAQPDDTTGDRGDFSRRWGSNGRLSNEIISKYPSKESVLETLLASCYIPVYYGEVTSIDNNVYLDGGLSNNFPRLDATTLTVAPYPGEGAVSPSEPFPGLSRIFPPTRGELDSMYQTGYNDFVFWANRQEAMSPNARRS